MQRNALPVRRAPRSPPLLAPERRAAAVAVLNLGAGLSQFIGPVVAGLVVHIGIEATVWIIAALYLVGFGLTFALEPRDVETGDPDT